MIQNNRFFGLDFLRATALMMVLLANCIYIFPNPNPLIGQLASLLGFFGLEIFFVLSGFLMCKSLYPIYTQSDFGFYESVKFIRKRIVRIAPLYLLILLVVLGIAFWMDHPVVHGWKYFVFLQNVAGPIPNFFPESWGLPIIVFGMLIFPVWLLFVSSIFSSIGKSTSFLIATLSLIIIFLATKVIYDANTGNTNIQQWDVSLKTVLVYRLDSVFIGVLFGWLYFNYTDFWKRTKWLWAIAGFCGIAFIAVGVGYFQLLIEGYKSFWNIIYLPLTSLTIALFLPILTAWENSILTRPVSYISAISYAAYLVHFSIILQLIEHFILATVTSNTQLFAFVILYLLSTLGIAAAIHFSEGALKTNSKSH